MGKRHRELMRERERKRPRERERETKRESNNAHLQPCLTQQIQMIKQHWIFSQKSAAEDIKQTGQGSREEGNASLLFLSSILTTPLPACHTNTQSQAVHFSISKHSSLKTLTQAL